MIMYIIRDHNNIEYFLYIIRLYLTTNKSLPKVSNMNYWVFLKRVNSKLFSKLQTADSIQYYHKLVHHHI